MKILGLLLSLTATLPAAEGVLRVTWDQQVVRDRAATTVPTALWAGDPACGHLQTLAAALAAADPALPDLGRAWQSWRFLGFAGAPDGTAAWTVAGVGGDASWASARNAAVADNAATCTSPGAPALPSQGQGPIACDLDAGQLVAGSGSLAPILNRILVGWRDGTGRIAVRVRPEAEVWTGSTVITGMTTVLGPVDPAIAARLGGASVGQASVRCAFHLSPQLIGYFITLAAGPNREFLAEVLGRQPGETASLLSGDVAIAVAPGIPLPRLLLVAGLAPKASPIGTLSNLGDAFRAKPAAVPGATMAWTWDAPMGQLVAGVGTGVVVFGTDPTAVAEALADPANGAWTVPKGSAFHLEAQPALLGALLPVLTKLLPAKPLGRDPLIAFLRRLEPAAEGLVGVEADQWARLFAEPAGLTWSAAGIQRHCRPDPALDREAEQVLGGTGSTADRLATRVAIWKTDGRPHLLVARRPDGYYAIQGGQVAGPLTEPHLRKVLTGMVRPIGRDLNDLEAAACPAPPALDARLWPAPTAFANVQGPWTATLLQDQARAELTERGAPVLSLLAGWWSIRWWQAARVAQTTEL